MPGTREHPALFPRVAVEHRENERRHARDEELRDNDRDVVDPLRSTAHIRFFMPRVRV